MNRVLFVGHDASRSGAPIVLLNLLGWLKRNSDLSFVILLKDGGALENEFKAIGSTFIWNEHIQEGLLIRLFSKLRRRVGFQIPSISRRQKRILQALKKQGVDLIYSNTVSSNEILPFLKKELDVGVLNHVHEMSFTIDCLYPLGFHGEIVELIDSYIVASKATRDNLVNRYKIDERRMNLVYEFVDIRGGRRLTKTRDEVRNELRIEGHFVVGGSGLANWRKGVDLFLALKKRVYKKRPGNDIAFVWVGEVSDELLKMYNYEKSILGDATRVYFIGQQSNPSDYFQLFDIFALTSREDPFPLVCLEAASMAIPLLCFKDAGGIPEIFENKGCIISPYDDVDKMAEDVLSLYLDNDGRKSLGQLAQKTVENYDVDIIAPEIEKSIRKMLQ